MITIRDEATAGGFRVHVRGPRLHNGYPEAWAAISKDEVYRYELGRCWQDGIDVDLLCFILLNPSTADALKDDPTVRKCCGFARRLGYGGIRLLNLYAYRATKPSMLETAWTNGQDVIGPANGNFLMAAMVRHPEIVLAWGASLPKTGQPWLPSLIQDLGKVNNVNVHGNLDLRRDVKFLCLGKTKGGEPRHPVRLSYSTPLVQYP